jgi:GT2 family glycosyltransferase
MAEPPFVENPAAPWITAVIATRHRAAFVAQCVESILRNQYPCFDLQVVDQSTDNTTENALAGLREDARLHYLHRPAAGLSAGRNLGIAQARGELIACTDDDCEAPPDWLAGMVSVLTREPRATAVFGNVRPIAHDRAAGFIPGYLRAQPVLARNLRQYYLADGMSGCMGLRRSMWETLGGFDEMLGSGARFRAAEDMDFAIRTLLAGSWVAATPEVEVMHLGFRSWDDGRKLIQGYLFGIGAMIAKHLKCGNWRILHYMARLAWRWAFTGPAIDLGQTPPRWLRLRAWLQGAYSGFAQPVDRHRCLFRPY